MRGGGAAARGRVYGPGPPETSRAGGRAVEGGAEATSSAQSGAGTTDTHLEAGTAGWSGENQQVGVFASIVCTRKKRWIEVVLV